MELLLLLVVVFIIYSRIKRNKKKRDATVEGSAQSNQPIENKSITSAPAPAAPVATVRHIHQFVTPVEFKKYGGVGQFAKKQRVTKLMCSCGKVRKVKRF